MIKNELLIKLKELNSVRDPEINHVMADRLLLEYINDPEITEAFNDIDKWYA